MNIGEQFLNRCLETEVVKKPWPHQIIEDTFDKSVFEKLQEQCIEKLNFPTIQNLQYLSI